MGVRPILSLAAVAVVSLGVYALKPVAPVLSLGVLYLFAVLPVAAIWGLRYALPVSVVSMLAFNWFFLPPTHTFQLHDSENWVALAVYLATAVKRKTASASQFSASFSWNVCVGGRKNQLNASMLATETTVASATPHSTATGMIASS